MKKILIKFSFLFFLLLSFAMVSFSQKLTSADMKKMRAKEDTLKDYSFYLNTDSLPADRMISDSSFTKTLVRALQIKNSFYYPFDSVIGISKLYAPDTSFRIFTWVIAFDDYYVRQKGAIQFRTPDGSLKLLPLRDFSEFTTKPLDSVRTRSNWIGAMYYNIIKTQHKGKNYYTLFGFDNNSAMSSMKWIEVLTFNEKNEPIFGGPFFSYEKDTIPKPTQYRFNIEFKKGARVLVNYIEDLKMILVDHLVSENDDTDNQWTYIPDGDQEGFKWENGKWVHIDKVFTYKLQDGQAPIGDPLLDPKGNRDEKKLQEKTDKNKTKENGKIPVNYDN
ncbi:MAG: hypothetical protein SGI96_13270 [Bacteroidota bacterium]|nr:hypothetical protein [Chitinophagaceae bacterium]MDZ4809220.1 hypothetical protein [Bacteroidota bacterium]